MRAHAIKFAGVDLVERFELGLLQVIAAEDRFAILLVLFLQLEIVE